jgi:hypothetical protein
MVGITRPCRNGPHPATCLPQLRGARYALPLTGTVALRLTSTPGTLTLEVMTHHCDPRNVIELAIGQDESLPAGRREEVMLVYLAYALFEIVMIGCLVYIMNAFDTDEPPNRKQPGTDK